MLRLSKLLIFTLVFCFLPSAKPSSDTTEITLQLRWHHQFQFAGYYAAKHKGYYKEAGLNVHLKAGGPGLEPVQEVLTGHATYGVANSELLHQRLKGKPLVALAAIFQHSASVLLARQESEIHSPQDLINRKVMMISKGADVGLLAMLHNEGIDPNKIKVIKSSYDINSLISGEVDAFNAYLTNEPFFLALQDIAFTVLRPSTYGVDFYSDILFTTEQELEQNPLRVKQFREASLRGWQYAMENPNEIIELILKHYNQQKKTSEHLAFEAESMRGLIMPNIVEYGHMNPGRWKHMADIFVKQGMVPQQYDLEGFIYSEEEATDLSYWYAISTALLIGLFIFGGVATGLYQYNRRLQIAISFGQKIQIKLEKQTALFEAIFRNSPDATLICDTDGKIILCNPAFCQTFGYKREQALGQHVALLYEDEEQFQKNREKHLMFSDRKKLLSFETNYRRHDGNLFPCHSISGPISDIEGQIFGCILVMRDITEQRRSQQEIVRMALTDPLTGLANRHQFNQRLSELFRLAKRQEQLLSMAIMDLDLFKQVNDEFGHPVGDQLLIHIAKILKETFRETDIIARIGGDEFAILMLNPDDHVSICQPAERLIQALSSPILIEGHEVPIGVSFGVATYPLDTKNEEELYRMADRALYLSKSSGRNRCSLAGECSE